MPFTYDRLARPPTLASERDWGDALTQQIRRKICKWIGARIVIVLVLSQEPAECKYRVRIDYPRPRRSDVEGLDLRALIRRAQRSASHRVSQAGMIFLIERIRGLEPGARVLKAQTECIHIRGLQIESVEKILFIALVVHDREFRRVQKPARIQSTHGNEIAPSFAAIGEIE